jgi:Putative phage tail protein
LRKILALTLALTLALILAFLLLPTNVEAAQLALSLAGGAIGFFFGGPMGFALGAMAGSLIGGLIFAPKTPTQYGPRLSDKTVQSSSFGAHITKLWGTDRIQAQVIFSSDLKETKHKTEVGGKMPGGSATSVTYTYAVDIMLSFGRRAKGVKRIWADTKLIFDTTGSVSLKKKWAKQGKRFVARDGNETQFPSSLEESYHGVGLCSAHRGLFCLEAADFQLANFANRIPNFTAEIFTEGTSDFGYIDSYTAPPPPYSTWLNSWGYIDPSGEIWAFYYPGSTPFPYPEYARIFHWSLDRPHDPIDESHALWRGDPPATQGASTASNIRVRSDESSAAVYGTNDLGIGASYFQLESGSRIDLPGNVTGMQAVEIIVKYGEDIYTNNGGDLYLGSNGGHINRFNLAGAVLTQQPGNGLTARDMVRSESYLWVLSGTAIWKYDAVTLTLLNTINVSAISNPLAIYAVSDTDLRIFSAEADGTRFNKILNDGPPVLDHHVPAATYSGLRGFSEFGLRFVNGMYVVDYNGGVFTPQIDFFGPTDQTEDIPLWKIVRDTNIMSGLDSTIGAGPPAQGDIAVGELVELVHGYALTRSMTYREALLVLQTTYFFDCREKDLKLDYPKRGKPPVALLPSADLAARSALTEALPDVLTRTRQRETELPLRIHVVYNNWEFSYQPGHEYAPRQITDATATDTIELAVAITSTKAQEVADVVLATRWLERETFQLKTSSKYLRVDAADNIEVEITETGEVISSPIEQIVSPGGDLILDSSGNPIVAAAPTGSQRIFTDSASVEWTVTPTTAEGNVI